MRQGAGAARSFQRSQAERGVAAAHLNKANIFNLQGRFDDAIAETPQWDQLLLSVRADSGVDCKLVHFTSPAPSILSVPPRNANDRVAVSSRPAWPSEIDRAAMLIQGTSQVDRC
jgi:hypothetical protein